MGLAQVIEERFELLQLAGSGGMGEIYRAIDKTSGHIVAVKLLLGDHASDRARFDREARVLAQLQHPGIVKFVAHGFTGDRKPYLAMEWLDGESLQNRLARGTLSIEQCLQMASRVGEALGAAHARGIVHRDIKPSNLFLVRGDPAQVKVLDFGIAHLGDVSRMTRTGLLVGTPGYMAPEQARGGDGLDPRADVFSLGCVLFECLTGARAFTADHVMALLAKILFDEPPRITELRPEVPRALDALLGRMLSKQPAKRPADGAEVAHAIERLLDAAVDSTISLSTAPPATEAVPSLTRSERRVLSVVLLGRERPLGLDTTQTAGQTSHCPAQDELSEAAEAAGGHLEWLADGSAVITIASTSIATDQALQAARCALAARALVPGSPIVMATGRGEVAGRLPVSDVLDRAARLLAQRGLSEARSRMAPITLDHMTADLLDARFEIDKRACFAELHGERQLQAAARTLLGKPTECVGRERELDMLAGLFADTVETPAAQAVLVTANAGIGKSRLAVEFVRRIQQRGQPVEVWTGRGDILRGGAAFSVLGQAIRGACGIRDGEPLALRRDKLRARIAGHVAAADRQRVADFLGELAGVPMPGEDNGLLHAARQNAELMGAQMRQAWEDFLRAECKVQPVLLVLEDLHWSDRPTVRFVDAALHSQKNQPWMVLALGRPEVHKLFPSLWADRNTQEIRLRALTQKASEKLVRQVLGHSVSTGEIERLTAQADGHAFYLEELIRAVAEGRGAALPETVLAMVQARLEALETDARRVLRAASIFGEVFWQGAVEALLGGAEQAPIVRDWLTSLSDREVVIPSPESRFVGEQELSFRHALLREGAYAMLTEHDRVLGHRLAAEWLEEQALRRDSASPASAKSSRVLGQFASGAPHDRAGATGAARLAEHFEIGREPARAAAWYARASQDALWAGDSNEASAHADRGIGLLASVAETQGRRRQELALQIHLATALTVTKGYAAPEVEQTFGRAWTLCQQVEDAAERFSALFGLWRVHLVRGEHWIARKFAEDLLALTGRATANAQSSPASAHDHDHSGATLAAHLALGISCLLLGEHAGAREHLEAIAAIYDRARHHHLTFFYGVDFEVQCLSYLAYTLWFVGLADQAVRIVQRACALADTLGHPFSLAVVLSVATNLHQVRRDREAVRACSERVLKLSSEHGFSHYILQATILREWASIGTGDCEATARRISLALSERRAQGAEMSLTYYLTLQAEAHAAAGQLEQALAVLNETAHVMDKNGERFWAPEVYRIKGEILRQHHGHFSSADMSPEDCFLQAIDIARCQHSLVLELRATVSLGRLWRDQGNGDEARERLAAVLGRFTEGFSSADQEQARALLQELS